MREKGIIEKLGMDRETKIITEDAWSGCGGCIYFIIDKDEPLFCGVDHHICSLDQNDERRNVCFEDEIIYKEWPLSDKEKVFNEMLEALIEALDGDYFHEVNEFDRYKKVIEKACYPKTWSQIKGLL